MMTQTQIQSSDTDNGKEPLLVLNNVSKAYKTPVGNFLALHDINATFYRGEFISIVGRSGSGKSTLLNMLTGIDRPTEGTVLVDDVDIHALTESRIASWRGRNMGIVFQFYQLLPMLSLVENVMLPMDFCETVPAGARRERAMSLLDSVGLADFAHKMPHTVSGGQQQSAAIARALANDPPIMVADEPTGNLDARSADVILHLFQNLVDKGKTIVMVTHDDTLSQRASRLIRLVDGEIAETADLRTRTASRPAPIPEPERVPVLTPSFALGDD
jgi:putative ABC transport system ATP-binding protein